MTQPPVSPYIFRAHGIRGIWGQDLFEHVAERAGRAFAAAQNASAVVVGADTRTSSPALAAALIAGLRRGRADVIDVGATTKAAAVFAGWRRGLPTAYVSASHLGPEWNGLKFFGPQGVTLDEAANAQIKVLFDRQPTGGEEIGSLTHADPAEPFLAYLVERIGPPAHPIRVLLDCGNGAGGLIAPQLFRRLGFAVETLFAEPDGRFPNRPSEPSPDALAEACRQVVARRCDLGLAFDGDADRVVAIDETGTVLAPERAGWLILRTLTQTQGGPIVANVSCSRTIDLAAGRLGREVIRVGVGTPLMLGAVHEHGACFGMESSQHLCIPSLLPFDDGVAVGACLARAVSALSADGRTASQAAAELPALPARRKAYDVPDSAKLAIFDRLKQRFAQAGGRVSTLDGVRVDFDDGWVLLRVSKTSPVIRLIAEADDDATLDRLWSRFEGDVSAAIASA